METTLQKIFEKRKESKIVSEVIHVDHNHLMKIGFQMDPYMEKKKTSHEILKKYKQIINYSSVFPHVGRNECSICFKKLPINDYYIDGVVFKKSYLHYLEEHDYPINPSFKKFILEFDFQKQHNTSLNDHFPSNIKEF